MNSWFDVTSDTCLCPKMTKHSIFFMVVLHTVSLHVEYLQGYRLTI